MSRRILFVLASPEYLRYFDTTMAELARRGHHVSIAVNFLREKKHARLDALVPDPRIGVVGQVPARGDIWERFARGVRGGFDFVRYLHPALCHARALRARAKRKAGPKVLWGLDRFPALSVPVLDAIYAVLRTAERAVPVSGRLRAFLTGQRPDLVVVSPLVDLSSPQVDLVRAAQSLGIPVALAVASWDNLTNKGHLRVVPDLVTVWNAHQQEEATTLHGIPADRVVLTGAQLFDRWFERRPSQSREHFCLAAGLPSDRPIVLYTGSSIFIARSELELPFVRRWLAALRSSAVPELQNAAILIRPHPFNGEAWESADLSEFGPVAIWPRGRFTPAAESARDTFFDSLYYSAAVVGINTSAMIEAAILGRPVLSLAAPEFAGTQEGTVHFRYLLPENGGFLRLASTFDEHVRQLRDVLLAPEDVREQLARFVDSFIRPAGREVPCTPLLADAMERAVCRTESRRESAAVHVIRLMLLPFILVSSLLVRPIDDDGRLGRAWWEGSRRERMIKRAVKQARAGVAHGVKRAQRVTRRLRARRGV